MWRIGVDTKRVEKLIRCSSGGFDERQALGWSLASSWLEGLDQIVHPGRMR